MLDFHTHILPAIDDGSQTAEQSLKMLCMLKEQGVNKVLLTPHFYAYESDVESFIVKRNSSLKKLKKIIEDRHIDMDLYLGCEVLYFDELWRIDDLKKLCINGTSCLLVEMPFSQWTDSDINGVLKLISKGVTPVIAHFDRYVKYQNTMKCFYTLLDAGVLFQMNCSYLTSIFTRRKGLSFIKKGMVSFLGTDCHNTLDRKPNYGEAVCYLKKNISPTKLNRLLNGYNVLAEAIKCD